MWGDGGEGGYLGMHETSVLEKNVRGTAGKELGMG